MSQDKSFGRFNLPQEILTALSSIGFLEMTPIQEQSLPLVLEGKDVLAQAKTGSGKTAAFGIGILSKLENDLLDPQALILCPTRELAQQVGTEIRRLARFMPNTKIIAITGGTGELHQERSLDYGVHIIVGTPGRIKKLIEKKTIYLHKIKTLVLDEADKMLDMGFYDDIVDISSHLTSKKQVLLFSATFPENILNLSQMLQPQATMVKVDHQHEESTIEQICFEVESHPKKFAAVKTILAHYKPKSVLIFCNTKAACHDIVDGLKQSKIIAEELSGDLEQKQRTLVLAKFNNNSCPILVATDVAGRGLDIKELELVISYDMTSTPEVHVHRIGRTGRAGKQGLAINLYTPNQKHLLENIEDLLKIKLRFQNLASLDHDQVYDVTPTMSTLFISGGRKDKIRPGDILGALTGDMKIPVEAVGKIQIMDINSYVAIDSKLAKEVVRKMQDGKIKGRKFRVGIA